MTKYRSAVGSSFNCVSCNALIKISNPIIGNVVVLCPSCGSHFSWEFVETDWQVKSVKNNTNYKKSKSVPNIANKKPYFQNIKDSFVEGYNSETDKNEDSNKSNQQHSADNSTVDKINTLIAEAESLTVDEKYLGAWQKWGDVVAELDVMIQDTKRSRFLAKGAGWTGAVVTGGIGLSDVFIVPLITKGLMKLFRVDLQYMLDKLEYALNKRHYCMYREKDIAKIPEFHTELAYFCWCYVVTNKNNNQDKLKDLLELIIPFEDGDSPKHQKSVLELYDEIEKTIMDGNISHEMRNLNKYLFNYLSWSNKTNNNLYTKLESMVFHE